MSEAPKAARPGSVPVPRMKRGVRGFYKDVVREMKHVTWPRPQETSRLTGVVLAVCAMIVVLLMLATFVFGTVVNAIVNSGGGS
jgi:preprotein translocase SecE subunit